MHGAGGPRDPHLALPAASPLLSQMGAQEGVPLGYATPRPRLPTLRNSPPGTGGPVRARAGPSPPPRPRNLPRRRPSTSRATGAAPLPPRLNCATAPSPLHATRGMQGQRTGPLHPGNAKGARGSGQRAGACVQRGGCGCGAVRRGMGVRAQTQWAPFPCARSRTVARLSKM